LCRDFHVLTSYIPDEIALYDRQIRLWGVQAQEKIRNANILLITMKALANEVAKNLVLAGIGSLTIIDHETVTETDLGAQFFISAADVGKNRAEAAAPQVRRLNPRVNVIVDMEDITLKGPSYFQSFDIVIATDLRPDTLNIINTATRVNHKAFYAAGVHGLYGFIFSDLIQHDYVIEREKGNRETLIQPETRTRSVIDVKTKKENGKLVEMVTKREVYSTWFLASDAATLPAEYLKSRRRLKAVTPILSCLRALWEFEQLQNGRLPGHDHASLALFTMLATQKHQALGLPAETLRSEVLRTFMGNVGSELAPVTAVLGGQLAQDVINVLGQRQQPIQNLVVFDGDSNEAPMYALHPDGALGEGLLPFSTSVGMVENGGMVSNGAGVEPNGQSFLPMPGGVET
jgi:ubiquitin-like 1-activating enzyme E1 A